MSHAGIAMLDPAAIFDKLSLSKGMRVADLGCGRTGHFIFSASRVVGDTGIIYAVDIVKDVLRGIESKVRSDGFENIQSVWSDIEMYEKTPIPANSLDACFLVNVMYLLKDQETTLREAARLLKKDGQLLIIDWSKKLGPLGPMDSQMLSPDSIVSLAGRCDLRFCEQFTAGDYHFGLLFKKM